MDRGKELMQVVGGNESEADKLEKLKEFVKDSANLSYKDGSRDNSTPLHVAVERQEPNIARFLAEHGGNVNVKNDRDLTPLELAKRLERQDIIDALSDVDRVYQRLDQFVKYFVKIYLQKVSAYSAEVRAGVRTVKAGATADTVEQLGDMLEVTEGGKPASVAVKFAASCWGKRKHRNTARRANTAFITFRDNAETLAPILARVAFDIFQSFEKQFTGVTALDGTWQMGIEKLANDAVNRSVQYVAKTKKKMSDVTSSLITEGVLRGKSKGYNIKFVAKPGHTLIMEQSGKKWNTSELYAGTGLLKVDNGEPERYFLKTGSLERKYGYRLALAWEEEKWDEELIHLYERYIGPRQEPYRYIVGSLNRQQKLSEILESVSRDDPQQVGLKTGDDVAEMKFNLRNVVNDVIKIRDCADGRFARRKLWFNLRRQLKANSFTKRLEKLAEIEVGLRNGVVVVCGLGGVGKSVLVNDYVHSSFHRQEDSVIWIDAKSQETAKHSFSWLGKMLGMSEQMSDDDGELKILPSLVEHVCAQVGGSRRILVLDNAEDLEIVEQLVPFGWPTETDQILVTSQNNSGWESATLAVNTVLLGDFSEGEAVDLVKKGLEIKNDEFKDDITTMVKMLYNFPLAIQQAIISIRNTNLDFRKRKLPAFTISEYMKEFKKEPKKLLNKAPPNAHVETIYKTVEVIINKVMNDAENGKEAMFMMNIIAFLAPVNILESMFLKNLAGGDEKKLMAITGLLESYLIVSMEDGMLSMNGLVQQVLRLKLEDPEKQKYILDTVLGLLKEEMVDLWKLVDYMPHILQVWDHAYQFDDLVFKFINSDLQGRQRYTTFIHVIAEGSPFKVFKYVLEKIRDERPRDFKRIINLKTRDNEIPLHGAALSGDKRKVELLLSMGAKVNSKKKHGWTPLHLAAKNGHHDVVQTLIGAEGVNVNVTTGYQFTPLHLAIKNGRDKIARLLVEKNADVNVRTKFGFSPLHFAAEGGNHQIASLLIKKGADVNATDNGLFTPMHLACKHSSTEIVELLVTNRDLKLDSPTTKGNTPLHFAGNLDIVKLLLARGARVDIQNVDQKTASDLASYANKLDIVDYIARHQQAAVKSGLANETSDHKSDLSP